jgi:hypothetical protein
MKGKVKEKGATEDKESAVRTKKDGDDAKKDRGKVHLHL